MEDTKSNVISTRRKGGRYYKLDPAICRYQVRLNMRDNAKFLTLFEQSGMKTKSRFIVARIFNKEFTVHKINKSAIDYTIRLTSLYTQYRAIGVNYNQVLKILNSNFSEKRALSYLYKLEKYTIELITVSKEILELTKKFEDKWLQK